MVRRFALRQSKWIYFGAAFGLLLVLAAELSLSVRQQSQTWDESVHLFSGYQYWRHRDFGANPEHPPLLKLLAALPLLSLNLKEQPVAEGPTKAANDAAAVEFLYKNTTDADSILFRARMAASVFTYLMAVLVFLCGWEMFGAGAALLALVLMVFEPNILANGGLVTTDAAETCFLFASVCAFYRYAKTPGAARLLVCGMAVALAWASKHSGILVAPILILLAAGEMLRRVRRDAPEKTASRSAPLVGEAFRTAFALVAIFAVGFIVLWGFYTFRFSARPEGVFLNPTLDALARTISNGAEARLVKVLAKAHILPESYLWGLSDVLLGAEGRVTFLLGRVYATGQWFYFPLVLLMKSTLGFLVLLAAFPLIASRLKMAREICFLAIPPVVFLASSMASGMNLGLRHILPILPFLILMAAATAMNLASRSRFAGGVVAALVLAHAASSVHSFPDYLTYSNEAVGGPAKTYRLMHGSNVDWGQGLKEASKYLADRHVADCWFAYTVPFIDLRSYQVPCKPLPSGAGRIKPPFPTTIEGAILIGANEAEGQLWGPDELNPYKQFFDKRPDDIIGNSILVFHGSFDVSLAAAYSHAARARQLLTQKGEDALSEAQAAAQLFPDSADVQATRCQALAATHRKEESQPVCEAALSIARRVHPEFQFVRVPSVRALAAQSIE